MDLNFDRVISGDSHVMEPADLWQKAIGGKHGDLTPRVFDEYKGRKGKFFWTGKQVRKFAAIEKEQQELGFVEAGYVPEKRVAFQEQAGVESEVLYTTHMLLQYPSDHPEVLRDSATVFNDWLAEFCSHDRKRLVGIAVIPMHDVAWAAAELERVAGKGLRGAMINLGAPAGCPPFRKRVYDPFWARAEELGVPITIHAATGQCPDPLHFETEDELEQVSGAMINLFAEVMPVLSDDFIYGGILDRFPALKLVVGEFDLGWLPYFMWRIDSMQDGARPLCRHAAAGDEGQRLRQEAACGTASSTTPRPTTSSGCSAPTASCGARTSRTSARSASRPRAMSPGCSKACPAPTRRTSSAATPPPCTRSTRAGRSRLSAVAQGPERGPKAPLTPSFPRKRESRASWTPASAGVTTMEGGSRPPVRGPGSARGVRTQFEGGYLPARQSCLDAANNEAQSSGGLPCVSILAKTAYGSVLLPEARSVDRSLTHA